MFYVGGDGEVVFVFCYFFVWYEAGVVFFLGAIDAGVCDAGDVFLGEFVVIGYFDELTGGVYEEYLVVGFAFFQHHDAGGDGCAIKEVAWQLDDGVYIVVVYEVFADFLFCAASVHDAWEADDGCCAVGG